MAATKIDLTQYCTQAEYAKNNDIKLGTLSQWIKRLKAGESVPDTAKHIQYLEVPELNLTLVKK